MALTMWPFGKLSEPPPWIQCLNLALLILLECICPCAGGDWLWGAEPFWKWSRMWENDAKEEARLQSRRARCCANDRDEWRRWARDCDLIPQRKEQWRTRLWIRQLGYNVKHSVALLDWGVYGNKSSRSGHGSSPFLRLPPELREQIYRYYILEWSNVRLEAWSRMDPGMPVPPHEPPITRVSKLIYHEALPVFYKTARFPLIIHQDTLHASSDLSYTAVDWYEHLGPSKLCLIRHLELYFCMRNTSGVVSRDPLVFNVDFGPDGNEACWSYDQHLFILNSIVNGHPLIAPHSPVFMDELLQKFRSVAQSLGPAGIISVQDIYKFIES